MKPGKPHTLKAANRARVLHLLRTRGIITVPELAAAAQLSRMTVGKIIDHFHAKGIVVSAGKGDSTAEGGKKPETYRLHAGFAFAVGVHIHPDHIQASLYNLAQQQVAARTAAFNPGEKTSSLVRKIARLCSGFRATVPPRGDGIVGIGIAVPGICNREAGAVLHSPWFSHWETGFPLAAELNAALGINIPVSVDNEFRFQLLAEKHHRKIPDNSTLIVLGGGRGLGSGIHHQGGILRGPHHLAGEVGHMIINPGGDSCNCGGKGCFEAMVHEQRVRRLLEEGYAANRGSRLFREKNPAQVSLTDVFAAVLKEDRFARELLDDVIRWFCIAISNIIVSLDPDIVIIHGLYARAGEYFLDRIRREVSSLALPSIAKTVAIEFSTLGEESGVKGAALHVIDEYFRRRWQ